MNRAFESHRMIVSDNVTDYDDVMRTAEMLRRLLLAQYDKLQFGHPQWSNVMFLLGGYDKCHATPGVHGESVVFVSIPCLKLVQEDDDGDGSAAFVSGTFKASGEVEEEGKMEKMEKEEGMIIQVLQDLADELLQRPIDGGVRKSREAL